MLNEVKSRIAGVNEIARLVLSGKRSISYLLSLSAIALFLLTAAGCNQEGAIVDPAQNQNLNVALQKITDNDESIKSFKPNYNEEQAISFLGVLGKEIYPLRVGQALKLVDRNLTIQYDTETAIGTLVEKFDGVLIISGSFKQPEPNKPTPTDTVISKKFSTVITRLIKYTKVSNTGDNLVDWKVAGVSLPAGGTETDNIQITKLTLATQDGTTLEITNPNEFFFDRGFMNGYGMGSYGNGGMMGGGMGNNGNGGRGNNGNGGMGSGMGNNGNGMGSGMLGNGTKGMSAMFGPRQPIKITVEVISKYEAEDFLTLTHGAMLNGLNRVKEKFELKSSVQEGSNYKKTYEKVWLTNAHSGFMHAVINALPKQVVFETSTPVEEKTWGIPYQVK
ncbi:MAG: hypothetical protein AB1298_04015 [Bacteroidota bacterium]